MNIGKCMFLVFLPVLVTSLGNNDTDSSEQSHRTRHLTFNGGSLLQPDINVITADRIRALLRNGYFQFGNTTTKSGSTTDTQRSLSTQADTKTSTLRSSTTSTSSTSTSVPTTIKLSTTPLSTSSPAPSSSLEEESGSTEEDEASHEQVSTGEPAKYEAGKQIERYGVVKKPNEESNKASASTAESTEENSAEETVITSSKDEKPAVLPGSTTTVGASESESQEEEDEEDEENEGEEEQSKSGTRLQVLQSQYKRIQSSILKNDSSHSSPTTLEISSPDTTTQAPSTKFNLLAQLFRGFGPFTPSTTVPPSPFLPATLVPSLQAAPSSLLQGTSSSFVQATPSYFPQGTPSSFLQGTAVPSSSAATISITPETVGTIPFEETTTATTEPPMPPPEPDYVLASKQLSPFVAGVKPQESQFTKEVLDAASQLGRLNWLVNYDQNGPELSRW